MIISCNTIVDRRDHVQYLRPIALASAVKIDESSGIRCILLWLSDITAQPTFESSFDPSV